MVASYLQDEGYRVIPVNPRATEILGEKSYPDLKSIPEPVDIVEVFRPASEVPAIVDEAIQAVERRASLVVLSDRGACAARAPLPSLLATAAVHQGLIRAGRRPIRHGRTSLPRRSRA